VASKNATTARFAAVVQACGRPHAVTLWTDPHADKGFMRAVEQGRVLTIRPDPQTRRDYGEAAFLQEPLASYLVFPKSLSKYKGSRIVGIKYELVEAAGPVGTIVEAPDLKPPPIRKESPKPKPVNLEAKTNKEQTVSAEATEHTTTSKAAETETETEQKPPPAPRIHEFLVTVEFTARTSIEQVVHAQSLKAARQQANQLEPPPGFQGGDVRRKILRVSKKSN